MHMEKGLCSIGQQEHSVLSAFCSPGLVHSLYKCVQVALLSAFKIHRLIGLEGPQKWVWYRYELLAAYMFGVFWFVFIDTLC